jgi:hypothetical protein
MKHGKHFRNSLSPRKASLKIVKAGFFLSAALILSAPLGETCFAASGGWSRSPSWAADSSPRGGTSSQSRRARERDRREQDLYPFAPGSNNLAIEVGQIFLMGDLGSNYSNSLGVRGHYTYGVSEMFGFNASLGYSSHSDGKFSMATLLTGLRTNLSWFDRVIPHINFGLGFYRPSYQVTPTSSITPTLFGVHLGPGIDLQLTNELFFGTALTFHDIFGSTEVTSKGPLDVGGTFTSFLIHAGATF